MMMMMDPPAPRPVYFVVEEIPLDAHVDAFLGPYQLLPHRLDNIAAAYHPVVEAILGSPINKAGRIASVYVNLRGNRWYEIVAPQAQFFQNIFHSKMLPDLLATGSFRDPNTEQLIWQSVPDMSHVMANSLPSTDTHIVGCLSGEDASDAMAYRDFISTALNDHSYVFVVGGFANGLMHEFITENIKVSSYSLTAEACMYQVCIELGNKWNIN